MKGFMEGFGATLGVGAGCVFMVVLGLVVILVMFGSCAHAATGG